MRKSWTQLFHFTTEFPTISHSPSQTPTITSSFTYSPVSSASLDVRGVDISPNLTRELSKSNKTKQNKNKTKQKRLKYSGRDLPYLARNTNSLKQYLMALPASLSVLLVQLLSSTQRLLSAVQLDRFGQEERGKMRKKIFAINIQSNFVCLKSMFFVLLVLFLKFSLERLQSDEI